MNYYVKIKRYIAEHEAGVILLIVGTVVGVSGFSYLYGGEQIFSKLVEDFYANASSEMISIAITVLIIPFGTLNLARRNC